MWSVFTVSLTTLLSCYERTHCLSNGMKFEILLHFLRKLIDFWCRFVIIETCISYVQFKYEMFPGILLYSKVWNYTAHEVCFSLLNWKFLGGHRLYLEFNTKNSHRIINIPLLSNQLWFSGETNEKTFLFLKKLAKYLRDFHSLFKNVCYSNIEDKFAGTYNAVQFSPQSCPTLSDPMDCSTPGLPVHHQLL